MKKDHRAFNAVALQVGKAAIIAALYYFFGLIGGLFSIENSNVAVIWPQAGFAFFSLIFFGYSVLPGIFIGSLLLYLSAGAPAFFSIIIAIGNILSVLFPALFIFPQKSFSNALDNYGSVFSLILFGAIISPIISASISVFGNYVLQLNSINFLPSIWGQRWMKDALGVLIFSPVLLVWIGTPFPKLKMSQIVEGVAIFLVIVGLELLLFFGDISEAAVLPISFLVIPLIIWSSVRLGAHGSSMINFLTALVFLLGVTRFDRLILGDNISPYPAVVSIIATMLVTSMIISATMSKLKVTQKDLSYLSTHDPLTGVFNRLFFEAEFARLENSRLYPISIIMADVDGLKEVNDTYGHRTGDQVLINVANLFSEVFRQEDIISRYGGDEFVILLPGTGENAAKDVLKRTIDRISVYNKEHADLPILISMGVSTAKQGDSLQGHLKNADQLMYQNKQTNHRA